MEKRGAPLPEAEFCEILDERFVEVCEILLSAYTGRDLSFRDSLQTAFETARIDNRQKPYIAYASHFGMGGEGVTRAVELGVCLKLFMSSIELHDDVIDGDITRRGRPNLVGRLMGDQVDDVAPLANDDRARKLGLIVGSTVFGAVYERLPFTHSDPQVVVNLSSFFARSNALVQSGQYADIDMSFSRPEDVTTQDVLDMYRLKTGHFSFDLALRSGAILAGANPQKVEALKKISIPFGIGIQIISDVSELFDNDPSKVVSDIRQRTKTLLLLNALHGSEESDREQILSILDQPEALDFNIQGLRSILTANNIPNTTLSLARAYIEYSRDSLVSNPDLTDSAKEILLSIINSAMTRLSKINTVTEKRDSQTAH